MTGQIYLVCLIMVTAMMMEAVAANCDPDQLPDIANGRKFRVSLSQYLQTFVSECIFN